VHTLHTASIYLASAFLAAWPLAVLYTAFSLGVFVLWRCTWVRRLVGLETVQRFRKLVGTVLRIWIATIFAMVCIVLFNVFAGDWSGLSSLWSGILHSLFDDTLLVLVLAMAVGAAFWLLLSVAYATRNVGFIKRLAKCWDYIMDEPKDHGGGGGESTSQGEDETESSPSNTTRPDNLPEDISGLSLEDQVKLLEVQAAKLASTGADVSVLSKHLDAVRGDLRQGKTALNGPLNEIRGEMYRARIGQRESERWRPYLVLLWELLVIGLWTWLGIAHQSTLAIALHKPQWPVLWTIGFGGVAGSLGAASFALYGWYTHMSYRSFECAFVPWYVARPFLGGVLGGFVSVLVLLIFSGLSAQGMGPHIATIGVGFLAGWSEKFASGMISRVMERTLGGSDRAVSQHSVS